MSLVAELQRRRVFRALVGYGVAAFAVLQIAEPIMHGFHWPDAVLSYVVAALALGFPVVVSLAWIFDVSAGRIERTGPSAGLRGARLLALLAGVGLLAAAPGVIWYFVLRKPAPASQEAAAAGPSIAVLPLVNLSSDKEQEYFSDGLSEELLNLLAKVPGLHVAARTSAFAFKGKNVKMSEIGQELGVATLLEGSVRKAGDRVRITTQLIKASDGYHLWSETFDRKLTDIFAVQDEIAAAVVSALKLKLLPESSAQGNGTSNPEAHNQYLLGRQFHLRNNSDDYLRAVQAYRKAIDLDPAYAIAWAALADSQFWVADSARTVRVLEAGRAEARAAADKAVALRPDLAEGYRARGFVRGLAQWDWAGAADDLQRALSLAPENADVLYDYTVAVLQPAGRLEEAVRILRKATEVDRLSAPVWAIYSESLLELGRTGEAREAANRSLEINPTQVHAPIFLSFSYLLDGRPAEALAASQRSTSDVFRLLAAALAHHDLKQPEAMQKDLDELTAHHAESAAYQIAEVYAWRGDKDRAFEWLQRALRQRDAGLGYLKSDFMVRSLRSDARWQPLLAAVNLRAE